MTLSLHDSKDKHKEVSPVNSIKNSLQITVEFSFLDIDDCKLTIEGVAFLSENADISDVEVFLNVNNTMVPCNIYRARLRDKARKGKLVEYAVGFAGDIIDYKKFLFIEISVCLKYKSIQKEIRSIRTGRYFPVTLSLKNAYAFRNGFIFTIKDNNIFCSKSGFIGHLKKEYLFLKELRKINTRQSRKAIIARCIYHVAKVFQRRAIWLFSDRINKADDNGEALFKYLNEHKVHENLFFTIRKDSKDYNIVKKIGKILAYNSRKHKLIHLLADATISSAGNQYVKNPFGDNSIYYQDILSKQKHVFLQHGIAQNNLTRWLNRFNHNFSMIVTSALPEYLSFLSWEFYYDENVVKLTGMPRHDRLYDSRKKIVTIMPTWRNQLVDKSKTKLYEKDGKYRYRKKEFKNTPYYIFYNSLLNDERLLQAAEENGYTIQFMPHPNIVVYIDWFEKNEKVRFCSVETRYRDIFAESALVVTDYSSVAFDFAYLRKPVLYCQFDREEFFKSQFKHGYFDYDKDGFGEVTYNLDDTVDKIIEYMKNDCILKEEYRNRINNFFAFHDKNNCKRVYEAIKSLD